VSGSGISWLICKSAPRSTQTTIPALHHSVFTGRMPFLTPDQQRQSTEAGLNVIKIFLTNIGWPVCLPDLVQGQQGPRFIS